MFHQMRHLPHNLHFAFHSFLKRYDRSFFQSPHRFRFEDMFQPSLPRTAKCIAESPANTLQSNDISFVTRGSFLLEVTLSK